MLLRRGDLDGAEPHLRAATAAGDRAAANNLGVLLHQRGYADEAAGWWRIAAVAGSAAAAHALGPPPPRARRRARRRVLAAPVRRAGPRAGRVRARRPAGAPRRRRRRALVAGRRRAGPPRGRVPAGPDARPEGRDADGAGPATASDPQEEAEQWYRQAAARGHRRAALHLGAILEKRGELKEAGRWYLTSAKDGEARAACALGFLLRDAGRRRRAPPCGGCAPPRTATATPPTRWARCTPSAARPQTAERWYRAAHGRGRRQRRVQPRPALRRAGPDRAGRAVVPPGRVRRAPRGRQRAGRPAAPARRRGRAPSRGSPRPPRRAASTPRSTSASCTPGAARTTRGALRWYERAAAAGHTEAALQVGIARLRDGDEQEAERHLRCAAGGGSAEAAFRLAARARRAAAAGGRARARRAGAGEDRVRGVVRAGRRAGAPARPGAGRHARRGPRRRGRGGALVPRGRRGRAAATAPSTSGCCWPARAASRRPRCGGPAPPTRGHGRAALRLALLAARRGELAEGQRWARRAVALGPAGGGRAGRAAAGRAAAGAVRVTRRARARHAVRTAASEPAPGPRGSGFALVAAGVSVTCIQRRGVEQLGSSLGS